MLVVCQIYLGQSSRQNISFDNSGPRIQSPHAH